MNEKILVVEDNENIFILLKKILEEESYTVFRCLNGEEVDAQLDKENVSLIILDVVMPGINGFQVCKNLRKRGVTIPILILTVKNKEVDKVIGLDAGADDYVTKPFGDQELLARVRALLRRDNKQYPSLKSFQVGDAFVDPNKLEIDLKGKIYSISVKELSLMQLLHKNKGKTLSRDFILNEIWGVNYYGTTRTLDQAIARLRKKIGDNGMLPKYIKTVHGIGYRLH